MKNLIGTHIGQHQITEQLGRGGMANVYKAFHPGLAVHRAIKVIRPDLADTSGFQDRFQREARAVAALRHPNIVQIHDFGQQDDLFYMIMEFVEGEDLKIRMLREGAIRPFSEVVRLIEQIAGALGYAHSKGVVHRDVKPDNVLLTKDGQAILADFGIAKIIEADDAKLTATGTGLGTPAYMAPEQAKGETDVGELADLYAIGVVLYEMLTAQLPFHADTPLAVLQRVIYDPITPPREFTADIPDALQGVVMKAMAKDPAHRYPNAAALAEAARQSLAGGEGGAGSMVAARPTPPPPPATAAVTEGGTVIMDETKAATAATTAIPAPVETRPVEDEPKEEPQATPESPSRAPLVAAIGVILVLLLLGAGAVAAGLWWFAGRGEQETSAEATEGDESTVLALAAGQDAATEPGEAQDSEPEAAAGEAEGDTNGGAGGSEDAGNADAATSRTSAPDASPPTGTSTPGTSTPSSSTATSSTPVSTQVAQNPPQERASEPASGTEAWRQRREGSQEPVAAAPAEPGARYMGEVRFGRSVYGEVEPEEPLEYTLEIKRPSTFYFDIVSANRRATYTLLAPDGSVVFTEHGSDVGPLQIDERGNYTLRVETDGGIPIQFELQFKLIGS